MAHDVPQLSSGVVGNEDGGGEDMSQYTGIEIFGEKR